MARPEICILTETYYPVVGGGETQAQGLAAGLVDNGFAVIVLTRRSDASLGKVERLGNATVYRLPPVGGEHYRKWGLVLTSLPALVRLRRQYDLIFVSGFRLLGVPAVLISRLLGKACILKADSRGEMSGSYFTAGLARLRLRPSSFAFRLFLGVRNTILRRADAFVAISEEMARELVIHGVDPADIHMIPNGVDTKRFHPVTEDEKLKLRRKLGLPVTGKIVSFTGRLVSYKGLPLLLRVWQEIQRKHRDVRLVLVGSGGLDIHNCEAELKAYVDAHSLQDSVRFTGDVHNVYEYLQASDIFAFPTGSEAFGISLIEAMACGLPVISTGVGGLEDILQHRRNGLLVEPGNHRQLYEALECLLADHALAGCLGKAARQTVEDRYSMETVTREYVQLFRGRL